MPSSTPLLAILSPDVRQHNRGVRSCRLEVCPLRRNVLEFERCHTSPALEAVERELAPKIAMHQSAVYMHQTLFSRIDTVVNSAEMQLLADEDRRWRSAYLDFVRQGARIAADQRERYAAIVGQLATLHAVLAEC